MSIQSMRCLLADNLFDWYQIAVTLHVPLFFALFRMSIWYAYKHYPIWNARIYDRIILLIIFSFFSRRVTLQIHLSLHLSLHDTAFST